MSKFKVGDKVKRNKGDHQGMVKGDTATVVGLQFDDDGFLVGIYLSEYQEARGSHDPAMFVLDEPDVQLESTLNMQPEPAHESDWSYAEAERLQKLAHDAIDVYNEYINAKPNTVFLTIFK